ncbi:pantoate--beta-alanine ligase [Crenothrix sp.]|uniref:pantoate--beta-alanine ligase n=1 Tax=Crenothrix sp. TaxID=3100433 RepID=UPI00374DE7B4
MQTVNTVVQLRAAIKKWRLAGESVAFVPTMGNLHAGHLKLVEAAKNYADRVVVSIFVNPTQFGVTEDFGSYPRTEAADQEKLASVNTDLVFLPSLEDMYAPGARTTVVVDGLSTVYCGASRPGHFVGVATVVCKLFNMVQPDVAVFGAKDFQQLIIIRTMVMDLNIPVDIIGVETAREESGLAMSSRNSYLSEPERVTAAKVYQVLCRARTSVLAGNQSLKEIEIDSMFFLHKSGFHPEYFNICRSSDLKKADADDRELVILTAAKLGKTRLIDNIQFTR